MHRTFLGLNPYSAALSPDSRFIAIAGLTVTIYQVENSQLLAEYQQDQFDDIGSALNVDFSPSNQYIVSVGDFPKLWIGPSNPDWKPFMAARYPIKIYARAPVGREVEDQAAAAYQVVFSPDGRTLAAAMGDGVVRLWDARQRKMLIDLVGHTDAALSAAYAPDGETILSGSVDQSARLWDAETGKILHILTDKSGAVEVVSYSPNSRYALTISDDGVARVWNTATGILISRVCLPSES